LFIGRELTHAPSGAALITLGLLSGASLTTAQTVLYVVTGALMACMWSPTNPLFPETAEGSHVSRQTTPSAARAWSAGRSTRPGSS
jgi:hypothetical protein